MSEPTARELLESYRYSDEAGTPVGHVLTNEAYSLLASRVEKVLEIHTHVKAWPGNAHSEVDYCSQCGDDWPCSTVRVLNGEEPEL